MTGWRAQAACLDHPSGPELWFPVSTAARQQIAEAVAVCRACPVRQECEDDAVATRDVEFGIRAGLMPAARRELAAPRARADRDARAAADAARVVPRLSPRMWSAITAADGSGTQGWCAMRAQCGPGRAGRGRRGGGGVSYPRDCPAHGRECQHGECPDYMAVWLRGACSSGDPLRSALVLVLDEFERRPAVTVDRDPANPAPGQRKALHETARRAFNATAWADHDVLDMLDTAVSAVLDALTPPVALPATLASVDEVADVNRAVALVLAQHLGWVADECSARQLASRCVAAAIQAARSAS